MSARIAYGINTVLKLLQRGGNSLQRVYVQDGLSGKRYARLEAALQAATVTVEQLSAAELEALTGHVKHQGVAAAVLASAPLDEQAALDLLAAIPAPLILVLDGVEDPRNFGAILRTAEAAAVDMVVTGRSRGVAITPVVSKVASGAAESQPMARVANLARFLRALREHGLRVVGADEAGTQAVFDADLRGPLALVMGGEGKGLRRLTRDLCDELVAVPMLGSVESLNVSVAAGVCLYEALRQRR